MVKWDIVKGQYKGSRGASGKLRDPGLVHMAWYPLAGLVMGEGGEQVLRATWCSSLYNEGIRKACLSVLLIFKTRRFCGYEDHVRCPSMEKDVLFPPAENCLPVVHS